jgi:hypothetical protein
MIARRVRTARIRAHAEDVARRTAITLEDALHTASLPDANGRIYAIRSLHLGRIPADASPATLARAVERAVQAGITRAVHAARPRASAAAAVWFADHAEVVMLLARALARDEVPRAWYWPLALPGWRPLASARESLRSLLLHAAATDKGDVLAVALLDALVAERREAMLLGTLSASDGSELLARTAWSARVDAQPVAPRLSHEEATRIARWAGRWSEHDPRTVWLTCARLASERPARFADRALARRAAVLIAHLREAGVAVLPDSAAPGAVAGESAAAADAAFPRSHSPARPQASRLRATDGEPLRPAGIERGRASSHPATGPDGVPPAHADARADAATVSAMEWSGAAGMLLVVSMLRRLGIDDVVSEDPSLVEAEWPQALLCVVARGLRIPGADPVLRAMRCSPAMRPAHGQRALTARWIRTLRRTSLAWLELPLRALVLRTGRIAATRTHVDVVFTLAQVDVAVRRAGIDIDPGWVPWLGRVVRFHYLGRTDA